MGAHRGFGPPGGRLITTLHTQSYLKVLQLFYRWMKDHRPGGRTRDVLFTIVIVNLSSCSNLARPPLLHGSGGPPKARVRPCLRVEDSQSKAQQCKNATRNAARRVRWLYCSLLCVHQRGMFVPHDHR